jgi:predicted metal-dependent hydrolase
MEAPQQNLAIVEALDCLQVDHRTIAVRYVRNRRARRYILRVMGAGHLRATVPPFGSKREAYAFAQREVRWIERQLNKAPTVAQLPKPWSEGTEFLFRGELVSVRTDETSNSISFAGQSILGHQTVGDLRPVIESHLFQLAERALISRALELAQLHGLRVERVTIRSQQTRWGSCSRHGAISLNWRLIQMPPFVADYIILHELMHLRQMNHSSRFWQCVEQVCPDYRTAEHWLKMNSTQLR